jgi:TPR repeat protein
MKRTGQFRSPRWAVLTCILAVGACADVQGTVEGAVQDAANTMDQVFGVAPSEQASARSEEQSTDLHGAAANPQRMATASSRTGKTKAADPNVDPEQIFQAAQAARDRGADAEALEGFEEAARYGHMGAQFALGEVYSLGRGVEKNNALAARWYGKAAYQGLPEAQYAYGLVHVRGLGLPINRAAGYRWLLLAARNGHERAEVVRRTIEPNLSRKTIKDAEKWVARFKAEPDTRFADLPTVKYVQQTLNTMGFDAGPVDGQDGPRTSGAVGKFQEKSGLARDGEITPELLDELTNG